MPIYDPSVPAHQQDECAWCDEPARHLLGTQDQACSAHHRQHNL